MCVVEFWWRSFHPPTPFVGADLVFISTAFVFLEREREKMLNAVTPPVRGEIGGWECHHTTTPHSDIT